MSIYESDIFVGPAGWHYKDWYGSFYPKPAPKNFKELDFLAEYFDTAEINSTFYRPANSFMGAVWVRKVAHNPRFIFTAKLWRKFTHERGEFSAADVKIFRAGIDPLMQEGKLGALLCQFPWSFKESRETRSKIEKIVESFSDFPLVFEFRHSSWDIPSVQNFLEEMGSGIAAIDQPVIGSSIPFKPVRTSSIGYVRLHGRNYNNWFPKSKSENQSPSARYDYIYSSEELDKITEVVKEVSRGAKRTIVIFNNHPWGQAIANSFQLRSALGEKNFSIPKDFSFPDI